MSLATRLHRKSPTDKTINERVYVLIDMEQVQTYLWSTLATRMTRSSRSNKYKCYVCRYKGTLNVDIATSNIIFRLSSEAQFVKMKATDTKSTNASQLVNEEHLNVAK